MTHANDILVTGASGVIGQAIARRLAGSGSRIHLAGRNKKALSALQRDLSEKSGDIYLFDLEDLTSCEKVVKDFFRRAKNPFGLVCNAGHLGPVGPYWTIPSAAWRQSISENFFSHTAMIHAFTKAMSGKKRPQGSIAVISGAGIGGVGDFSKVSSYSTSKAALVHLVEALSEELKTLGLTINAIAPGPVLSQITKETIVAAKRCGPGFLETAKRCVETGGVSPDLAAQLVEFLMSAQARDITGRLLSARFDQATVRQKAGAIAHDASWYRLRRIDYDMFSPKSS